MKQLLKRQSPIVYGDGSQTRDFIYIDDIVYVLQRVMSDPITGILNVGSGKKTSFNQVVSTLQIALGTHITPCYVPQPKNYLLSTHASIVKLRKFLPNPLSVKEAVSRMIKC